MIPEIKEIEEELLIKTEHKISFELRVQNQTFDFLSIIPNNNDPCIDCYIDTIEISR